LSGRSWILIVMPVSSLQRMGIPVGCECGSSWTLVDRGRRSKRGSLMARVKHKIRLDNMGCFPHARKLRMAPRLRPLNRVAQAARLRVRAPSRCPFPELAARRRQNPQPRRLRHRCTWLMVPFLVPTRGAPLRPECGQSLACSTIPGSQAHALCPRSSLRCSRW